MAHMRAPRQPGKATKGGSELRPIKKKSFQADPLVWRDSQLKKNDPGELDRKGDPRVSTDTVEVTLCPQYTECVSAKNDN